MDILATIGKCFASIFTSLGGIKILAFGGVSFLALFLFYIILDALFDFLYSVFFRNRGD